MGKPMMRDLFRFLDNNFAVIHECALEVAMSRPALPPAAVGEKGGAADEWNQEQQIALQTALKVIV